MERKPLLGGPQSYAVGASTPSSRRPSWRPYSRISRRGETPFQPCVCCPRARPRPIVRPDAPRHEKTYATDLSDKEWACLRACLPEPSKTVRRRAHSLCDIFNAVCYVLRRLLLADVARRFPALAHHLLPLPEVSPERGDLLPSQQFNFLTQHCYYGVTEATHHEDGSTHSPNEPPSPQEILSRESRAMPEASPSPRYVAIRSA